MAVRSILTFREVKYFKLEISLKWSHLRKFDQHKSHSDSFYETKGVGNRHSFWKFEVPGWLATMARYFVHI
jgi:hypothetical protein